MITKIKMFSVLISILFMLNIIPLIHGTNFSASLSTSRTIMDIGQIAYLNITGII